MASIKDKKLSDYYRYIAMPGTIKRFRNGKARVELDDTGSQDSEGHNSYHDFEFADLRPLSPIDKAVPIPEQIMPKDINSNEEIMAKNIKTGRIIEHEEAHQLVKATAIEIRKTILSKMEDIKPTQVFQLYGRIVMLLFQWHFHMAYNYASEALKKEEAK